MTRLSIEGRTRKYVKGHGIFAKNLANKYGKKIMATATKTRIGDLKTASKKVVHEKADAAEEFIGNKIAYQIVKPKPMSNKNSKNVQETVILPEERNTK